MSEFESLWLLNATADNSTSDLFRHPNDNQSIMFLMRKITIPLICMIGFLGNAMSAVIYFGKDMRKLSCSVYLGARSISDNGYIISLFCGWLDFVDIRVFHIPGLCQVTLFLSYVCSFFSVWCVVFITCENFVRICKHEKVATLCTVKVSKYVTSSFALFAILYYTFPLWSTATREMHGKTYCMTKHTDLVLKIQTAFVFGDTILTLVLPLVVIMVFMGLILRSGFTSWQRSMKRASDRKKNIFMDARKNNTSPYSKVARLLTTVTVLFLVLHTPSHAVRIKEICEAILYGSVMTTANDRMLQHIFSIVYYVNYAVTWLVYIISGKKFRRVFYRKFFDCNSRQDQRNTALDTRDSNDGALNSTTVHRLSEITYKRSTVAETSSLTKPRVSYCRIARKTSTALSKRGEENLNRTYKQKQNDPLHDTGKQCSENI